MLPLHQSARPASLSWLSTTFRVLSRVEYGSYHITKCLVLDSNQNLRYAMCCHYTQLSIYREKGVRSPVCLRVSLIPIFYHTLTVYSLSRETVIQGPLVVGDCYLGIIRIQTITYPSSVFLLYSNHGFLYTAHQPYLFLTYNSTSINWI